MSKKQITGLFICSLTIWTLGNGLLPLLPVYAKQLGAKSAETGYYMSFIYFAIAASTVTAGWLSDKLQRRKMLLLLAGVLIIPSTLLLGQVPTFGYLILLTAVLWFLGGMGLTLVSILAGMFAEKSQRGKVFGTLALTGALGSLIGGLTTGPIADWYGYPTMFTVLAIGMVLLPLAALVLEDRPVTQAPPGQASVVRDQPELGNKFFLFVTASILIGIVTFSGILGISLTMIGQSFASTAIASTQVIGGAVALPIPPIVGWLSDRIGRKRLLALSYLMGTLMLLILAWSISIWHFWLVAVLRSALFYANNGLGQALVTDLVAKESLARGIALFNATAWIGGILGFGTAGYAIQNLGLVSTFVIGSFLPPIAIILLVPIRQAKPVETLG
ncbi:MAG TPA: MFS transporter [Syntrophales bacterium]|nr:MFS transporter [Syntrophales bacterium]